MKILNLILTVFFILQATLIIAVEKIPSSNLKGKEIEDKSIGPYNNVLVPLYSFSRTPIPLLTSYYDYMIGSYNGLPLHSVTDISYGGGYFLTFQGKRYAANYPRVFYGYIDASNFLDICSEITDFDHTEGYPILYFDPVFGKPFYAWQCNTDTDTQLEVQFSCDAFIECIFGLFYDPVTIINNPITVLGTNDNEFLWPSAVIGPSPALGKRRIYIVTKNSQSHTYGPSENPRIAYADFNSDDIEYGNPLIWSYTSIPELDQWNINSQWRRPYYAITCDNYGNLYYAGFHIAKEADGITNINEQDLDVFVNPNYGEGTWTRISEYSNLPSWNPDSSPTNNTGYFTNFNNLPYADNEICWKVIADNSSHFNAIVDDLGRIHYPALWGLTNADGNYYSALQYPKEVIFDLYQPTGLQFKINEIWPQKEPANTIDEYYQPWDNEFPWGEAEYVQDSDTGNWHPKIKDSWDFPYWDESAHNNEMPTLYNNIRMTEGNGYGMLAVVWQNCWRAKQYNVNGDTNYSAWANTPEIWISVSSDNGNHWSEPIKLNNVETPQFAGIKPMWVYPASKVKYVGMQGHHKVGRLGLMFFNDYTWGSYVLSPGVGSVNNGGQVMFTELEIVFPLEESLQDPFGEPIILSGSMNVGAAVCINNQFAATDDVLAAFVDVNDSPQLRGKGSVIIQNGIAGCSFQVYTDTDGEIVYFKVWDVSTNQIYDITGAMFSQVNGNVGSFPDDPIWLMGGYIQQQNISLSPGWNMVSLNVHPNSMDITDVFASIMGNIIMIKSPEGVFTPGNPYNTLSHLSDGKGIFVKVSNPCVLSVTAYEVDITTPIYLQRGWNLLGYLPQNPMDVSSALISLTGNYIQVKGVEGIYEPNNPYSTLSVLSPGRAYWIKLLNPSVLFYAYPSKAETYPQSILSCDKWGSPIPKTNSQSVLCSLEDFANEGDQLAAIVNSELRGLATLINHNGILGTYINIFTDISGEIIEFKLIKKDSQEIINLLPNLISEPAEIIGDYNKGIYYTLRKAPDLTPEIVTGLVSVYPNPFSVSTSINFNVGKEKQSLQIEIYNLRGQKIATLLKEELESGNHNIIWNGTDENGRRVASGVYLCKMHFMSKTQSMKIMIIK